MLLNRLKIECDLIVLTECWLMKTPTIPILYILLQSYCTERNLKQNDGVVEYIREHFDFKVAEPSLVDSNVLILTKGTETAIIAVYRQPSFKNIV